MPAALTIAGADVLDARLDLPLSGRWTVEATIATATAPAGRVTVACEGGLDLSGTIARARVHLDACAVWIVGGAGGLARHVAGAYRNAQLRDPLGEVARACGETLDTSIASSLLSLQLARWSLSGTGAACLDQLAAEASRQTGTAVRWRITPAGKIWIGAESWPAVALATGAEVLDEEPGQAVRIVGAETPAIEPGQDVAGVGRVVRVVHEVRADECRSRCYIETDALAGFRRAVRGVLGLRERAGETAPADTAELWRGLRFDATVEAAAADGSTVDVRPINSHLSRIAGVRLRQPFPGATVVCAAGAIVEVGWQEGDPGQLWAMPSWQSGSASKIVINGTTVILGAESGAQFVALANLVLSELQAISTAFSGHTHAFGSIACTTGVISGTVASGPTYTASSVAATQTKAK